MTSAPQQLRPGAGTVTVRRATPADARTVHTLVLEIAAHEGDSTHVAVTPEVWARLLGRDDVLVTLAEADGQVLGYASAVRRLHLWSGGDVLAVDDVYVRPGARDQGVGRRLLVATARVADVAGLTVVWGVEPGNHGAQRFYRRLGATLRDKVVAAWTPTAYRRVIADAEAGR
ncbi:GNAT family N-acetyltransferase [Cellulomonas sp.]|uniref:GNAT family N-acetyltransferase n=1 Tax=Cellulomonas sp. TaxID=40001 RepID=UPI0028114E97|nr:GNAT family N-acetyltransferase [Cellulomonas sp.]